MIEGELERVLNLNRVLVIVNEHPGEYSPTDLITSGLDDPGLLQARSVVEQAGETGRIDIRQEIRNRVKVERCYPK